MDFLPEGGTLVAIAGAAAYGIDTSDRIVTATPGGKAPIAFSYDANGDLLSGGTRTCTYNQEGDGRVMSATAGSMTASYRYVPYERRYSKTVNGTTTVFVYDNAGKIIAEYNAAGTLLQDFAYLPGTAGPLAARAAAGNVY